MKFTFKTTKSTGRYRSFSSDDIDIKYSGKVCGSILPDAPHHLRFMIIKDGKHDDGNPNCKWMWIELSKNFTSVQDAKDFANRNIERIFDIYTIHTL